MKRRKFEVIAPFHFYEGRDIYDKITIYADTIEDAYNIKDELEKCALSYHEGEPEHNWKPIFDKYDLWGAGYFIKDSVAIYEINQIC